jgi:hypothetical protein
MPVTSDAVVEKVTDAARHVEDDGGASPVLVAVVQEFQAKLAKAQRHATDGLPGRDSVISPGAFPVGGFVSIARLRDRWLRTLKQYSDEAHHMQAVRRPGWALAHLSRRVF